MFRAFSAPEGAGGPAGSCPAVRRCRIKPVEEIEGVEEVEEVEQNRFQEKRNRALSPVPRNPPRRRAPAFSSHRD